MSMQISLPVNQVRLTNVAVVRMNRHGKRFELACYRNKVVNYRQGTETDLSEVLQTDRVFTNVSKGDFAKSSDLQVSFGTTDSDAVCRIILSKGQLQVADMERNAQYENLSREVAVMIAEKCVNPSSNRLYTVEQIRDAMKEAEFVVHPTRSVKRQFLDCVKMIIKRGVLPLQRAKMQLCVVMGSEEEEKERAVKALVEAGAEVLEEQSDKTTNRVEVLIDPSLYRAVDAIVKDESVCGEGGRLEITKQCVYQEGDVTLETELARKNDMRTTAATHTSNQDGNSSSEEALVQKMNHAMKITDDDSNDDKRHYNKGNMSDEELPTPFPPRGNTRKSNKKAQKKSKKAKRREKEDAAERQLRVDAEKARQEERAFRLGKEDGDTCVAVTNDEQPTKPQADAAAAGTKACNTCGGSFTNAQFRAHFRSDWHRYNLNLKMKGVAPICEMEFQMCDADMFLS